MEKVKISIIVPVYKVEPYLIRCLDSLINQSLQNIEIILVDDESPDNCPQICDEYQTKDSRIKVIHKKNEGLGFARNAGLEIATGEFIAFVDSDDYVDINMYNTLYAVAKEHALENVFCGYCNVDKELNISSFSEVSELTIFKTSSETQQILMDMIACRPGTATERKYRMSVWHAIYCKQIIDKYNIRFQSEREYISEDILFHFDFLVKATKIAITPDSFYYYCYNDNSLTKSFRRDRFEKQKALYLALLQKIEYNNLNKKIFKQRVDRLLIGYIRTNIRNVSRAGISYAEKKILVGEVCNDSIWQSLHDFPFNKLPYKYRFINLLIKKNMIKALLFLFRFL